MPLWVFVCQWCPDAQAFLIHDNKNDQTTDTLSHGFGCPKCDKRDVHQFEQYPKVILLPTGKVWRIALTITSIAFVILAFALLQGDRQQLLSAILLCSFITYRLDLTTRIFLELH